MLSPPPWTERLTEEAQRTLAELREVKLQVLRGSGLDLADDATLVAFVRDIDVDMEKTFGHSLALAVWNVLRARPKKMRWCGWQPRRCLTAWCWLMPVQRGRVIMLDL